MIKLQQTYDRDNGLKSANELYHDVQLVKRACTGHEASSRQVMEQVFDRIFQTLSFMSNNTHDVDDLVQNALLEVLASLPTYRGDCPLIYWAEKIAVRTAAKTFEKHRRRTKLFARFRQDSAWNRVPDAEEATANIQLVHRFQYCIGKLSDEQRAAIVAHHINGYALPEIASMCQCSVFTIKGRLRRGRRALKKIVVADPVLSQWVNHELNWRVL